MIITVEPLTDWQSIIDNACFCRGTDPKPMTTRFLRKMIISQHSPLRSMILRITVMGIPYYTHVHYIRHHVGHNHYVLTQGPGRPVDYDRRKAPQDEPVNWRDELNAQALLDTMRLRLCQQADPMTRGVAIAIRDTMLASQDVFLQTLGWACRPKCEWMGFQCPEAFKSCGRYPPMRWWQADFIDDVQGKLDIFSRMPHQQGLGSDHLVDCVDSCGVPCDGIDNSECASTRIATPSDSIFLKDRHSYKCGVKQYFPDCGCPECRAYYQEDISCPAVDDPAQEDESCSADCCDGPWQTQDITDVKDSGNEVILPPGTYACRW